MVDACEYTAKELRQSVSGQPIATEETVTHFKQMCLNGKCTFPII